MGVQASCGQCCESKGEVGKRGEACPSGSLFQHPAATRESRPEVLLPCGSRYRGEWLGRQRDGHGLQTFENGSFYEGQWRRDSADGVGRLVHANGEVYDGHFRANRAFGRGSYREVNGCTYEGQWVEDIQHGHGVETKPDGVCYEGQFRSGLKSGKGVFTWPDGSSYSGSVKDNILHGHGSYFWADGRRVQGQWVNSKMEGHGVFNWPDGCSYDGQYVNDLKHGAGEYMWPDGNRYIGQFALGAKSGSGFYTSSVGQVLSGASNGKLVTPGTSAESRDVEDSDTCTRELMPDPTFENLLKPSSPPTQVMVQRLWSPSDVGDDFPRVVPEYEFDEEDGRVNHLRVEDFSAPFVDDGEEGWTGLAQLVKPPPRVGEVRPEGAPLRVCVPPNSDSPAARSLREQVWPEPDGQACVQPPSSRMTLCHFRWGPVSCCRRRDS